jgi:AraC family transcriptional regulator of adaptative response / DNA-3-methyladenine glycosylase II
MNHVAIAAGYGSTRRFNDTFRKTYGRSPRDLRKSSEEVFDRNTSLSVRLPYRKPFNWAGMLEFLGGRATPGVEQVSGGAYLRTVSVQGQPGVVECRHDERDASIRVLLHGVATTGMFQVVQHVREMLDVDAPFADIVDVLDADKQLRVLLRCNPGTRVPGAWDGFELTVRAILGQQISVKAATTLAGRIVLRYGQPVVLPASLTQALDDLTLTHLFPTAAKLARARFNDIGLVSSRAETIRRVASAVSRGEIDFDQADDPDAFCQKLMAIRGIGAWTAEYVAMRALKYPDALPAADLGLLKATGYDVKNGAAMLKTRAESWRPWRAYAALLLWSSLSGSGG